MASKLRLDDLAVDSFVITEEEKAARGTVRGHSTISMYPSACYPDCTYAPAQTCGWETCIVRKTMCILVE